jgi:hypothetical protein
MRRQYTIDENWDETAWRIRAEHPGASVMEYSAVHLPLSRIARLRENQPAFVFGFESGYVPLPRSAELELRVLEEKPHPTMCAGTVRCSSIIILPLADVWGSDALQMGYPSRQSLVENLELLANRAVAPEELVTIARYDAVTIPASRALPG